ncbi:hypothetical protein JCM5350_002211 [Sporobolomyces pararoseus]
MSRPPMNLIFPEKSNSGISRNQDGQRVIAPTRRPDGTFRQEIKIRPGYTPQEDVSLFRSSKQVELDQHRARKGTVPGLKPNNPLVQDALRGISGGGSASGSKSAKKNAKRKEKRNEGATSSENNVKDSWDDDDDQEEQKTRQGQEETTTSTSSSSTALPPTTGSETSPETTTEDPAKKLRNLKKKLKQTQQLKEKRDGGVTLGQAEQDKVDGMNSLEEEIAKLELA